LLGIEGSKLAAFSTYRSARVGSKEILAKLPQYLEYLNRAGDIQFVMESFRGDKDKRLCCSSNPCAWEDMKFAIRVCAYTGIGAGVLFKCRVGDSTFEPVDEACSANVRKAEALMSVALTKNDSTPWIRRNDAKGYSKGC
jgi:hypothetical protein